MNLRQMSGEDEELGGDELMFDLDEPSSGASGGT